MASAWQSPELTARPCSGKSLQGLLSPERPKVTSIASLPLPTATPAVRSSVSGFWLGSYDPEREEWMGGGESRTLVNESQEALMSNDLVDIGLLG